MIATQTSRIGKLRVDGGSATLTFERRVPHPIEAVWNAITQSEEMSKWYLEAKIDGRVGGRIQLSSDQGSVTGKILTWDPPHVFEHEWIVDRSGFPQGEYGIIRWELVAHGNETILKLTHRGLTKETARNFASGIHAILDRLEAHLDKKPLPDWQKRQEEVRPSYFVKSLQ